MQFCFAEPAKTKIKAVILRDLYPSSYVDKQTGRASGFAVELLNEIARRAGYKVDYRVVGDWKEVDAAFQQAAADVCPVFAVTAQRQELYNLTATTEAFEVTINVRADDPDIKGIDDLIGRPIGTVKNSLASTLIKDKSGLEVTEYKSYELAIFDLLSGNIDAYLGPRYVVEQLTRRAGIDRKIKVVMPPLLTSKRTIGVRKDLVVLYDRLQTQLLTFLASPEYRALYLKWHVEPTPFWNVERVVNLAIAIIILVVILLVTWRYRTVLSLNAKLARQVEEQNRVEEELRGSEARLADLFKLSPEMISISQLRDGTYVAVNDAFTRIMGFEREEVLGRSSLELGLWVNPDDRKNALEILLDHGIVRGRELVVRKKDGSLIDVLFSATWLKHSDQNLIISIVTDVSELKRVNNERLLIEKRLLHSQKLESLGILAGGIAHDFNNLLTAIIGRLDLALQDPKLATKLQANLDKALQAARRAEHLTRQMLAYSGKGHFELRKINMNQTLKEQVELLEACIPKAVQLMIEDQQELPLIKADSGQIQQVVMNLITNAAEAIGESYGEISMRTGVSICGAEYLAQSRTEIKPKPGRFAYLEVRDSGCGMSADTCQRLFDPFFTTKFKGRGLGMSAVLGIVQGHGGAIMVDSEEGHGTTVRVLFPALDDQSADEAQAELPDPSGLRAYTGSGTILVVDDEPTVAEICSEFLKEFGFQTLTAADGVEALAILKERTAEIRGVVLDLTMPRMDGLRCFEEIKRLSPEMPVILCSGFNLQEARARFAGQGLSGFLQKPYGLRELSECLKQSLARCAQ